MKKLINQFTFLTLLWVLLSGCSNSAPVISNANGVSGNVNSGTSSSTVATKYYKPSSISDPRVDQALKLFNDGEYDAALVALQALSQDQTITTDERRQVNIALAKYHAAGEEMTEATQNLNLVLAEEPPLYEPNPDQLPLEYLKAYYAARKQKTGGYGVERADPGVKNIAIMDFAISAITPDGERFNSLDVGIPQVMLFQFQANVNLKVIERARINWIMEEQNIQHDSGMVDQNTAVRVGKILAAHAVVFGNFVIVNNKTARLVARVVKVETSEILAQEQVEGKPEDILALADQLAIKLARNINDNKAVAQVEQQTKSLDAMLSYAEALALYHTQGPASAIDKFKEALAFDPSFEKAKEKVLIIEESLNMAVAQNN